jgi:membrane protein DedA with SNARE-associated domain
MHALAALDVTQWVDTGGLVMVLVLMTAESVGVPFPSEVIMPLAGVLAAEGHLNLVAAIAVGALGNLIGSLIAYGLAAWLGEPLLLGPLRIIGIRRRHVELADRWFRRHGLSAVFWGRLLPVVRTYISFPAGLARVPLLPFALLTPAGALPWCAALAVAGYEVGQSYTRFSGPISVAGIVLAVILAGVVVAWFVRGRQHSQPGPEATAPPAPRPVEADPR